MKPAPMIAIADIKTALGCSLTRARDIMLKELPHIDISAPGSRKPTWRVERAEFDRWMKGREQAAGNERMKEFTKRYMR